MTETTHLPLNPKQKASLKIAGKLFCAGLLLPLGFAPFHWYFLSFISLAYFYHILSTNASRPFWYGFSFGCGFFSLGISWLYVSIQLYGHLHPVLSFFIVLLLIGYQALYIGLMASFYSAFSRRLSLRWKALVFASCWIFMEYCRANCLEGFPWLLIGTGQFDSPIGFLLPQIGVYGLSFLTCLGVSWLVLICSVKRKRIHVTVFCLTFFLIPCLFRNLHNVEVDKTPHRAAILQENFTMGDKLAKGQFYPLLLKYLDDTKKMLGQDLIILPESAIPLPYVYVKSDLDRLDNLAKTAGSAIFLGIPTIDREDNYYNSLMGLGLAKGVYFKQKLVPFGEYFPKIFQPMLDYLGVENSNLAAGLKHQSYMKIKSETIATLICYELAYPQLFINQLATSNLLVSISDDGWFGHSLAIYQQQQIAQTFSALTGRYQIVANNNGLSSIIDEKGNIIKSLPAFQSGILQGNFHYTHGVTPWLLHGDKPLFRICGLILLFALFRQIRMNPLALRLKRRYPYEPEQNEL